MDIHQQKMYQPLKGGKPPLKLKACRELMDQLGNGMADENESDMAEGSLENTTDAEGNGVGSGDHGDDAGNDDESDGNASSTAEDVEIFAIKSQGGDIGNKAQEQRIVIVEQQNANFVAVQRKGDEKVVAANQKLKDKDMRLQSMQERNVHLQAEVQVLGEALTLLKTENGALSSNITALKTEIATLAGSIEELERDNALLLQQVTTKKLEVDRLLTTLGDLRSVIDDLHAKLRGAQADAQAKNSVIDDLNTKLCDMAVNNEAAKKVAALESAGMFISDDDQSRRLSLEKLLRSVHDTYALFGVPVGDVSDTNCMAGLQQQLVFWKERDLRDSMRTDVGTMTVSKTIILAEYL
ncbi:hypothetical protein HK101_010993 [Irineochytrium annulatum]|nr:hypothetical protein HK101_010993 [Irineochytrium annulatum]